MIKIYWRSRDRSVHSVAFPATSCYFRGTGPASQRDHAGFAKTGTAGSVKKSELSPWLHLVKPKVPPAANPARPTCRLVVEGARPSTAYSVGEKHARLVWRGSCRNPSTRSRVAARCRVRMQQGRCGRKDCCTRPPFTPILSRRWWCSIDHHVSRRISMATDNQPEEKLVWMGRGNYNVALGT